MGMENVDFPPRNQGVTCLIWMTVMNSCQNCKKWLKLTLRVKIFIKLHIKMTFLLIFHKKYVILSRMWKVPSKIRSQNSCIWSAFLNNKILELRNAHYSLHCLIFLQSIIKPLQQNSSSQMYQNNTNLTLSILHHLKKIKEWLKILSCI